MDIISRIADFLIYGFIFGSIPLVIFYFSVDSLQHPTRKIIVISNILALIGASIYLIPSLSDLLANESPDALHYQATIRFKVFGPYWFAYCGRILFKGLIPQLLWFRKIRNSIWTIIFIPFLAIDFYFRIIMNIIRSNNAYLPSSWNPRIDFLDLSVALFGYTILYLILAAAIYKITGKRSSGRSRRRQSIK